LECTFRKKLINWIRDGQIFEEVWYNYDQNILAGQKLAQKSLRSSKIPEKVSQCVENVKSKSLCGPFLNCHP
jgi:hypothetical protein